MKCLSSPDHTFLNACIFPIWSYKKISPKSKFDIFYRSLPLLELKIELLFEWYYVNFSFRVNRQYLKIRHWFCLLFFLFFCYLRCNLFGLIFLLDDLLFALLLFIKVKSFLFMNFKIVSLSEFVPNLYLAKTYFLFSVYSINPIKNWPSWKNVSSMLSLLCFLMKWWMIWEGRY